MKYLCAFITLFNLVVSIMPLSAMDGEASERRQPLISQQIETFLLCNSRLQSQTLPPDVTRSISANMIRLSGNINIHTRNLLVDSSTNDEKLLTSVRMSPFAKTLDVSFCDIITGAGILNAIRELTFLNTLNLKCCSLLKNSELVAIARQCRKLTSINIAGCYKVTTPTFQTILETGNEITSIYLSGCPKISANAILHIVKKRPNFVAIGLECHKDLPSSKIIDIVNACSAQTCFTLSVTKTMNGPKLLHFLQQVPNLVSLELPKDGKLSNLELLTLLELHSSTLTVLTLPYGFSFFREIQSQIKINYPNLTIYVTSSFLARPLTMFYNNMFSVT